MKQNYEVVAGFWHKGQLRAPGEVIAMTEAEAKYLAPPLGNSVVLKTAPATPPAAPAAE